MIGVTRRPRSIEVRFSVGLGALHERSRGWSGGCPEALRLTVEGCARRGRRDPGQGLAGHLLGRRRRSVRGGAGWGLSPGGGRGRHPPHHRAPGSHDRPDGGAQRDARGQQERDHEEGDEEDRGAGDPEALREWSTDQGPEPAAGLREGVGGPVDGRPPTGQLRQPGDGHEPEERADEAPDGVGTTPDRDDRRAAGHENRRHEEPHHPDQVTQGRVGRVTDGSEGVAVGGQRHQDPESDQPHRAQVGGMLPEEPLSDHLCRAPGRPRGPARPRAARPARARRRRLGA